MHYRRATVDGGAFFFTVNLAHRQADTLVRHADALRRVYAQVRQRHPFTTIAIAVMPEHLHALWQLPPGDADYATRWALIKAGFSRQLPPGERISASRASKGERGIWQRRYWEHQIRDEADLQRPITSITTPSNTATCKPQPIGHIHPSTGIFGKAYCLPIGAEVIWAMPTMQMHLENFSPRAVDKQIKKEADWGERQVNANIFPTHTRYRLAVSRRRTPTCRHSQNTHLHLPKEKRIAFDGNPLGWSR